MKNGLQFAGTRKFLSAIMVDSYNAPQDGLFEYRKDLDEAIFLFNDDLVLYLEEIHKHAVALGNTKIVIKDPETEAIKRTVATKSHADEYNWLTEQIPKLSTRFSPYMKFKTWN